MDRKSKQIVKIKNIDEISVRLNEGVNTPVSNKATKHVSKSEAALYKQAQNPLGDPHKI